LINSICRNWNEATVAQALGYAPHKDLVDWEYNEIPYTMRKNRQAFFAEINIQKTGGL